MVVIWWSSSKIVSGSRALPPWWLPQCSCVVIVSSFDPGERLQAPGSLWFYFLHLLYKDRKRLCFKWGGVHRVYVQVEFTRVHSCSASHQMAYRMSPLEGGDKTYLFFTRGHMQLAANIQAWYIPLEIEWGETGVYTGKYCDCNFYRSFLSIFRIVPESSFRI